MNELSNFSEHDQYDVYIILYSWLEGLVDAENGSHHSIYMISAINKFTHF